MGQLTRADLAAMSAEEVVQAHKDGRCDLLLRGIDVAQADQPSTGTADQGARGSHPAGTPRLSYAREVVASGSPEEIVAAHRRGDYTGCSGARSDIGVS
jgi:hypothetical protein